MRTKTLLPLAAGVGLASGIAGLGYSSVIERNAFTLRRYEVPVLDAGSEPLRVLQISDAHLTPGRRRLRDRFVQRNRQPASSSGQHQRDNGHCNNPCTSAGENQRGSAEHAIDDLTCPRCLLRARELRSGAEVETATHG